MPPSPRAFVSPPVEGALKDLRDRLIRTRAPRTIGSDWSAGTDASWLASFLDYWANEYDWRQTERRLQNLSQVIIPVHGVDIHALHLRAHRSSSAPLPIVLTHGWPSSFFEFLPLAERLTDPARFGADPSDAFDVVVPSLPGFGFSSPLADGPVEPSRIAGLWVEAMSALGYGRFGAYGGDIGSHVTDFLGADHPDAVIGLYTHHPNLHPVLRDDEPLTDSEQAYLERRGSTSTGKDYSYADVQTARPDSLAQGLSDSPAGLAAWILEKYYEWSENNGSFESVFSHKTLADIVTLYWLTNCIGSSFRPYHDDALTPVLAPVTVPAGVTLTPEDADYPRSWAERTYRDLRQWRGPSSGGHFLALEQPDQLAADLRDFYRPLRA